jgi:hypothetical protein
MQYDYIIVGGGIAGLYTAYRLNNNKNKALFESTCRLGGCIQTDTYLKFKLEYGASRFQINNHKILVNLLDELNIDYKETDEYQNVNVKPKIDLFTDDEKFIYNRAIEHDINPIFYLFEFAITKILGNQWNFQNNYIFDGEREFNMKYLKYYGTFRDKPLWTYGIYDLFNMILSNEVMNYIKLTSSFYHVIDYNMNALSYICYMLDILAARGKSKLYTITNGMQELITKLQNKISENTFINTQHTLISIEPDKNRLKLIFSSPINNKIIIYTKKLFLCVNQNGIRNIKGLPRDIKDNIESIIPIKLFKLFVIIKNPPWKNSINSLKYINNYDIPCRELTYHYMPENDMGKLIIYGDLPSIIYWKPFCKNKYQIYSEDNNNTELKFQIQNKLYSIFETNKDVHIIHYGIRDWSLEPFESGIHFWKPNINPVDITKIFRCFKYNNSLISICGESFAFNQGYIESALQTVNESLDLMNEHEYDIHI